jgi:hypothetical protein
MTGQSNSWSTFDCPGTTRRWRVLPDLRIEIENHGPPAEPWPKDVDQWATIVAAKAAKYQVPAYWIAAIMALETGGRPGLCLRKADGTCSKREGMGLMAMLLSTAEQMAGRPVTEHELLNDYDLQIDLGAKLIAYHRDREGNDYVKVAISYNAGSVKCGNGNTFQKPKEPCPPTPWGVVMGCVRSPKSNRPYCAPSAVVPGYFACPVDYPQVAIGTHNAALEAGWTASGLGTKPPPGPPVPPPQVVATASLGAGAIVPLLAGGALGFLTARFAYKKLRRR